MSVFFPFSTVNLDDIDELTLGHVLKHLFLIDLCMVARVNLHLRMAARAEFAHRYRLKRIQLVLVDITPEYHDEKADEVKIYGLKHCLFVLRCFGDLIGVLSVDLACNSQFRENLISKYSGDHCGIVLQVVEFFNLIRLPV